MATSLLKWDQKYSQVVYVMALLGATDQEFADALSVSPSTIANWKNEHPEFLDALRKGKLEADAKVAHSFYMNTQDRYVEVEEVHVVKGVVQRINRQQFIQGDKWTQDRWLAKRRRGDWTDSQQINIQRTNTNINIDLTGLTFEEKVLLERIAYKNLKALPEGNDGA